MGAMAKYQLRRAERSEFEPLYVMHRAAMERYVIETWRTWDDAFQRHHFREFWPPERKAILVEGQLAGFLDLVERDGMLWVGNIELAPEFHSRGVGSAMLRDIQRVLQNKFCYAGQLHRAGGCWRLFSLPGAPPIAPDRRRSWTWNCGFIAGIQSALPSRTTGRMASQPCFLRMKFPSNWPA